MCRHCTIWSLSYSCSPYLGLNIMEKDELLREKRFKKIMGEAFQSDPEAFPGAYIVGKFLVMGSSEEASMDLARKMNEELKQHTFMELVTAIHFIDQTRDLISMLKLAMILSIKEQGANIKRN